MLSGPACDCCFSFLCIRARAGLRTPPRAPAKVRPPRTSRSPACHGRARASSSPAAAGAGDSNCDSAPSRQLLGALRHISRALLAHDPLLLLLLLFVLLSEHARARGRPPRPLDALQAHVADCLNALSTLAAPGSPLLSLPFLSKLLDVVVSSDAAFCDVLALGPTPSPSPGPPTDHLAADLLDRAVKTLDVLNAASLTLASLQGAHHAALTIASCLLTLTRAGPSPGSSPPNH